MKKLSLLSFIFLFGGCAFSGRKSSPRLESYFQTSKPDVEWHYIKKAGAVYEIAAAGVTANRVPPLGGMPANYVTDGKIEKKSQNAAEFVLSSPGDEDHYRDFKPGEKVYIGETWYKDGKVHMFLISVDTFNETYKGETKSFRYVASVVVPFAGAEPDPAEVEKTLAPVLKKVQ